MNHRDELMKKAIPLIKAFKSGDATVADLNKMCEKMNLESFHAAQQTSVTTDNLGDRATDIIKKWSMTKGKEIATVANLISILKDIELVSVAEEIESLCDASTTVAKKRNRKRSLSMPPKLNRKGFSRSISSPCEEKLLLDPRSQMEETVIDLDTEISQMKDDVGELVPVVEQNVDRSEVEHDAIVDRSQVGQEAKECMTKKQIGVIAVVLVLTLLLGIASYQFYQNREAYEELQKINMEQKEIIMEQKKNISELEERLNNPNCSKVLALFGGGNNQQKALSKVETLLFPQGCNFSNIKIPDLPVGTTNLVVVQNGSTIILCGGCKHPDNCGSSLQQLQCFALDLKYMDTGWKQIENLKEPRIYSAGFEYGGSIFVTGGTKPDVTRRRSTVDVLHELNEPWELGNQLLSPVTHHCIVKIDNYVFSTGGLGLEEDVIIFNGFTWSKFSQLIGSRYDHGCIGFKMHGEPLILVKGGRTSYGGCSLTEIFNIEKKKSHPQKVAHCRESSTIHNINGRIFLIGGVITTGKLHAYPRHIDEIFVDKVYAVTSGRVNGFNLEMGRSGHAALVIDIEQFN